MIATHVKDAPMGRLMELMQLTGSPVTFEAVCRTSDGMYLGQMSDDLGYNAFLGDRNPNPTDETKKKAQDFWNGLTPEDQDAVLRLAAHPPDGEPIPIQQFVVL